MAESRSPLLFGLAALAPAALYAVASEHGRPYMLGFLFSPQSTHSTSGLALLALALIVGPVVALIAGWRARRRQRLAAFGLVAAALLLLLAGLTTQQPYLEDWALGPAASD